MASSEDHVWSWSTREVFGDGTIRFHCGVQGARRLWDDDLCVEFIRRNLVTVSP